MARRDNREYRTYLRAEQRRQRGCIARRMQRHLHHGLLGFERSSTPGAPRARLEWSGAWGPASDARGGPAGRSPPVYLVTNVEDVPFHTPLAFVQMDT